MQYAYNKHIELQAQFIKPSTFEFSSTNATLQQHYLYCILVTLQYYSAESCMSQKKTVLLCI